MFLKKPNIQNIFEILSEVDTHNYVKRVSASDYIYVDISINDNKSVDRIYMSLNITYDKKLRICVFYHLKSEISYQFNILNMRYGFHNKLLQTETIKSINIFNRKKFIKDLFEYELNIIKINLRKIDSENQKYIKILSDRQIKIDEIKKNNQNYIDIVNEILENSEDIMDNLVHIEDYLIDGIERQGSQPINGEITKGLYCWWRLDLTNILDDKNMEVINYVRLAKIRLKKSYPNYFFHFSHDQTQISLWVYPNIEWKDLEIIPLIPYYRDYWL